MRHLLTLLTTLTLHAQPPSYVPTDGLVGWWPFNGNANDESGNGNNGVVNGATLIQDRNGANNSAFSFDGISDFIVANTSSFYVSDTITISLWINTAVIPSIASNYTVFELGGSGSAGVRWGCIAEPNSAVVAIGRGCGGVGNAPVANNYISGWSNFVYVIQGSTQSIYYNGSINGVSTNSLISSLGCSVANLYFGVSQWSSAYYFTGSLDDIGIWNRALTPTEIQSLYTGQGSSPCVSPTAVTFSGLGTSYTTSDGPETLTGTPAGGVFIGPGVTGSTFSPAVAGEGAHSIQYIVVDNNGCVNSAGLCTTVGIGMGVNPGDNALGGVRVFPNPNRGQFTVELELTGLVGLQVFDARGALVHNEVFTASGNRTQRTLDLSAFAKGNYTLQVEHDGQRVSQTVVVD